MSKLPISAIAVVGRHRKDLGDIDALSDSIRRLGLLHPVVVTRGHTLIAGERRLEACRRLGWSEVPVTVATDIVDARTLLEAERDENTCREEMKPSEKVALGRALEDLEQPDAARRKAAGQRAGGLARHGQLEENFTPSRNPQTGDIVGAAIGMSRPTYQRAKMIIETAEDETLPQEVREIAAEAAREMDERGKVSGAYYRVRDAVEEARAPEQKEAPSAPTRRGAKVSVPDGKTAEDVTREGMALEATGASSEEIAEVVGWGGDTYRKARYIVTLADRRDLSDSDAELVGEALAVMNEDSVVRPAFEIVEPLVNRIYGGGSRSATPARAEAIRRSNFDRAFGALIQACIATPYIEIPHLSPQDLQEVCAELKAAAQHINNLRRRVEEENR